MRRLLIVGGRAHSLVNLRGNLLVDLVCSGYEVHAVAPDLVKNGVEDQWLSAQGVQTHQAGFRRTSFNIFIDLRDLLTLIKLIKKLKIDFYFGYNPKPMSLGVLAAKAAGVKNLVVMVTGLGLYFTDLKKRRLVSFFIKLIYRLAMRYPDIVFFQNSDDQRDLVQLKIIKNKEKQLHIRLPGSGVDVDVFHPDGHAHQGCSFLFFARLLRSKGVIEYLEAAKRIKKLYPYSKFLLAGSLDKKADALTIQEIKSLTADAGITYLAKKINNTEVYKLCSIFVLPSYREGMPRTVLEAMACGKAIITTDVPGCREAIIDNEHGFLVKSASVSQLYSAMERFCTNDKLAREMGERSRRRACDVFDVQIVNRQILESLGQLCLISKS